MGLLDCRKIALMAFTNGMDTWRTEKEMVLSQAIYTLPRACEIDQLRPYKDASAGSLEVPRREENHTSKKPLMKLFGSLALGSSSARKYLSTCESCFQKLRVSYMCCQSM